MLIRGTLLKYSTSPGFSSSNSNAGMRNTSMQTPRPSGGKSAFRVNARRGSGLSVSAPNTNMRGGRSGMAGALRSVATSTTPSQSFAPPVVKGPKIAAPPTVKSSSFGDAATGFIRQVGKGAALPITAPYRAFKAMPWWLKVPVGGLGLAGAYGGATRVGGRIYNKNPNIRRNTRTNNRARLQNTYRYGVYQQPTQRV